MPLSDYKQVFRNVNALRGGTPEVGDLYLQDYHLIFCFPPASTLESNPTQRAKEGKGWFAFQIISQCIIRPTPSSCGIPSSIRIRFRDFTYVSFNFGEDKDAREAFDFIRARTCRLGSVDKLLAFHYKLRPDVPELKVDGWNLYDPRAEFKRQGISEKSADRGWRMSTINKDYQLSPTYPCLLAVPSKISDNTIKYAANFRSRARIPALTYLHPINNCAITRSSQPFTGLRFKRSVQDERLVAACFSATNDALNLSSSSAPDDGPSTSQVNLSTEDGSGADVSETERRENELISGNAIFDEKTGKRLIYGAQQQNLIVDARPAINSYAMQAVGMGSENMEYYKFAKKVFLNIDNIHVMRDSLQKVIDAIKDSDVSPFPPNRELLAKSNWLKHITFILEGSYIIARQVAIEHSNVLIHCSDGWDRTSQLSALSQLMLDPYYRTVEGYIVLIEKDWLSFGHMFQLRSGHLSHESWFITENDALAGSTIRVGENESRGEANHGIGDALASAKRFFNKGKENPVDGGDSTDDVRTVASIVEDQATKPKDVSPVFHQFLDATYQLLRQHPTRFEFNERFLRRLLYHVYSCQYGTFLCNNERERYEAHLKERTQSVWGYFLSRKADFSNSQYDPDVDDHIRGRERLVFPRLKEVRWWHQLFNRTDDEMNGDLNASAAIAERVAAYTSSGMTSPTTGSINGLGPRSVTGSPSWSPQAPTLATAQSALTEAEASQALLASDETKSLQMPSLNRSASTEEMSGNFARIQERISDLGIGNIFGDGPKTTASSNLAVESTGENQGHFEKDTRLRDQDDQELRDMN